MTRDHVLSTLHGNHNPTSLPISSLQRINSSARSSQQQEQYQTSSAEISGLSNRIKSNSNLHEQLAGDLFSSMQKSRKKTATTSRSAMHMLKARSDRHRQKQQTELQTLLVEPWKQMARTENTLNQSIPNAIDVMRKMCGTATPFERNLRQNYHRQLCQYRNGSMQC
jgi:hypothetical protein